MERNSKLWHFLHLIEGEENVNCQRCRKSVLGITSYKCLDCTFFVHESCGGGPDRRMDSKHDLSKIQHVISTELGKYGEEEVICSLCEKRVPHTLSKNMSIIYKCIIPKCKFLTHESCIELPVMMVDYSHDPPHTLFLKPPVSSETESQGPPDTPFLDPPVSFKCHVCQEEIMHPTDQFDGSFYYKCVTCFSHYIHAKCGAHWKDKASKCNPHKYIPFWKPKPIEFTCDVCGKKSSDIGLFCSECRLLIHPDCARFIHNLMKTGHKHPLNFTLSLGQDKHNECQACGGKVNTSYGAYCCEEGCEYVFHLFCGYVVEQQGGINDPHGCPPYLVGWIGDGEDIDNKRHPSHPKHDLLYNNEEPRDKVCDGCMESVFVPPFYSCRGCDYFCLHLRCAQLPEVVNHPASHPDPLSLHNGRLDLKESFFKCWECDQQRRGFFYKYHDSAKLDIQCTIIPDGFTHPLHKHQLFRGQRFRSELVESRLFRGQLESRRCPGRLVEIQHSTRKAIYHLDYVRIPVSLPWCMLFEDVLLPGLFDKIICNACGKHPEFTRMFNCKTCNFKVCIKCLTLPLKARHKYDRNLLNLVNTLQDDVDKNYCQICENKINQGLWFYYCNQCDFSGHSSCVLEKKKT